MRDGNSMPSNTFSLGESVLRLPMRDGNSFMGSPVLRLPMRDGNSSGKSLKTFLSLVVLRLPMRDGNLVLLGTVRLGTVGS